jgi:hypothetical protein
MNQSIRDKPVFAFSRRCDERPKESGGGLEYMSGLVFTSSAPM